MTDNIRECPLCGNPNSIISDEATVEYAALRSQRLPWHSISERPEMDANGYMTIHLVFTVEGVRTVSRGVWFEHAKKCELDVKDNNGNYALLDWDRIEGYVSESDLLANFTNWQNERNGKGIEG